MNYEEMEHAFLERNHIPKLQSSAILEGYKTSPRSYSSKDLRMGLEKQQSGGLPAIKKPGFEQEQEIKNLIKKNLIFDGGKQSDKENIKIQE